ncbi:hypothetical protein [Clostridium grantii]|uniref:YD repeat-containing protein n=1 Tax=Clostridium grantii DSM 8605 TaxID=1121316 RepID=A0A1M5TG40_9CLOT|nr:hypothetical protein [Clostridium grantii]SHH49727.1 YD repeat-containing protein [Clostridium grantii DSM 8605]
MSIVNGINYRYIYDLSGRLGKVEESDGNSVKYQYDLDNNISNVTEKIHGTTHSTSYTYDKDSKLKNIAYSGNNIGFNYDVLGRLNTKTINTGNSRFITDYDYEVGKEVNTTTTRVGKINNNGNEILYAYDANGNISNIKQFSEDNLVQNNNFVFGTSNWTGIDSIKTDAIYGNVANKKVTNSQLYIAQQVYNIQPGTYKMATKIKSDNYSDLSGVGFVFYYTDGTYSDYTWTANTITDLGNEYKLYEKNSEFKYFKNYIKS